MIDALVAALKLGPVGSVQQHRVPHVGHVRDREQLLGVDVRRLRNADQLGMARRVPRLEEAEAAVSDLEDVLPLALVAPLGEVTSDRIEAHLHEDADSAAKLLALGAAHLAWGARDFQAFEFHDTTSVRRAAA